MYSFPRAVVTKTRKPSCLKEQQFWGLEVQDQEVSGPGSLTLLRESFLASPSLLVVAGLPCSCIAPFTAFIIIRPSPSVSVFTWPSSHRATSQSRLGAPTLYQYNLILTNNYTCNDPILIRSHPKVLHLFWGGYTKQMCGPGALYMFQHPCRPYWTGH